MSELAAPPAPSAATPRIYALFDFDWSLINENSDCYVFKVLAPHIEKSMSKYRHEHPVWTDLMDHCLHLLSQEGVSAQKIHESFEKIPIFLPEIRELLTLLHQANARLFIISDANTHFIDSILETHGLFSFFTEDRGEIHTNPSHYEGNRLRVRYYHQAEHGCARCPRNLCKGAVFDEIHARAAQNNEHPVYIYLGDGSGDFCPSTRMAETDVVAARNEWALHKMCVAQAGEVRAKVRTWSNGQEMMGIYKEFVETFHPNSSSSNSTSG